MNMITLFFYVIPILFLSFTLNRPLEAYNLPLADYPCNVTITQQPEKAAISKPDLSRFVNLEDLDQDFILGSKQIFIKEYPTAFNPTIVRLNGELLLCFRTRHPKTESTDDIAMVWLDENFDLKSTPKILEVPVFPTGLPSKKQDPRLIVVGDKLYMVLNNTIKGAVSPEVRRMFMTEVHTDGNEFYTDPLEPLFNFQGEREQRWEKNWVPFVYNDELLLAYSLTPHRILKPIASPGICEEVSSSHSDIHWDWGVLRGGTQAYLDGGKYLGFFHSSINLPTVHSEGKIMPHYVMGAYLFSAEPPFEITHISPEPIVGKGFYTGPAYKTWKPLRVVFPGGFVFDDNYIWVVYGKQDFEVWVVKFDKQKLIDSLVPVTLK